MHRSAASRRTQCHALPRYAWRPPRPAASMLKVLVLSCTLPQFLVYESNASRLDVFDAAVQRQITYFFTRAGSLAGHLHAIASTRNESREACKRHAIDAQNEINNLSELGDDLLRDLRKLVSRKQPGTISRA